MCKRFGKKTKLLSWFQKLQFLRINENFKLELAKLMSMSIQTNFLLWVIGNLKFKKVPQSTRISPELLCQKIIT